ncbi:replication initiation protein, partial [Acinetobacter nosocomialis]
LISLSDFRHKIGVLDTEYKRMYDFKKYVLDIALKQVNEHNDITVKVEQHKTGRSITGFSFSFKQKKSVSKSAKSIGVSVDITITLT